MPTSPKLDAATLAANLAETCPPLGPQAARREAERCLYCFDAPCIRACPTAIDIPAFIRKIADDNPTGAARTILSANILGASCARVCPTAELCEGACVVRGEPAGPVPIGRLQRFATDAMAAASPRALLPPSAPPTGRRVAVVGGGPAGLGCAAELARLGHSVVVYEKRPRAGGLNTHGVAYYKMRPEVSLAEVALVASLGVQFRYGEELGRTITLPHLELEYAAVFLGLGLSGGRRLGIPGENLPGVVDALEFLEQIRLRPPAEVPVGHVVAVIGGGNTAIDAARHAHRLGARRVICVCRRGPRELAAYPDEVAHARAEGVEFVFHARPAACEPDASGHVAALRLDPHAPPAAVNDEGYVLEVDMVIRAIGQPPAGLAGNQWLPGLEFTPRGDIARDPLTGATNRPGVFAGGDCANGGREVVHAVAEGRRAARAIHTRLTGEIPPELIQASGRGTLSADGPASKTPPHAPLTGGHHG